jgi:(R,R)-butanediol dehydrogenase/meso-butanediol dehydrogenase/diacetyl reductase
LRAAFLKGPRKIVVQDTADPKPKPDHVIVKVRYCGICGSDLHAYESGIYSGIIGHEFSGEIESIGESVKGWKIGDRVTANANIFDNTCYYCRRAETNLCMSLLGIGVTAPGAFAERVPVRFDLLRKLSDNVSFEEGTLVEPLATPLRAVRYSVRFADTVLVMGAGPIGLFALECSRIGGATKVYVSEVSATRSETAKKLGADKVFDPTKVRLDRELLQLTGGIGPDVVIETTAKPDVIRSSESIVRKGGIVMIVGLCPVDVPTNYIGVAVHETQIKGVYNYSVEDFELAARLIEQRQLDVSSMVSDKIGLSEIVEKGFEELLRPEKNHIKILVDPQR